MNRFFLMAALVPLAGCMSLSDYGEAPGTERYGHYDQGYPGWWGQDAYSLDLFYGSLGRWGRWDMHPSYGRIWYPGGMGPGWQPYTSGYWVNDPRYGMRWISRDPFGFATDHYGRWMRDGTRGWYWVPGTRFSSGWSTPPMGWRAPPAGHPSWRPGHPNWRPDARPPQGRPDAGRPGSGRPEANRPGSGRPDVGRPGWQRPDGTHPRARPDGRQPDRAHPRSRGEGQQWVRPENRPQASMPGQRPQAQRPENRPQMAQPAPRPQASQPASRPQASQPASRPQASAPPQRAERAPQSQGREAPPRVREE